MRCDVNVSVRPKEQARFGRRVEVKNMNSFSAMQRAIEFEINRQVGLTMLRWGEAEASPTPSPRVRLSDVLCHAMGVHPCSDPTNSASQTLQKIDHIFVPFL